MRKGQGGRAKPKLVEAKESGADAWQMYVNPAFDGALHKAQKLYEDAAARFGGKQAGQGHRL